ncbi:MAG TPA: hypothetical protein VGE15_08680 [Sphingobacteriaceae bacterium]
MNKAFFMLLLLWAPLAASGQEGAAYIETAGGGKFRFHYNEQYFLVDKNCEFLARTRISSLTAEKQFTGPFTDFGPDGATLMTGYYQDGTKEGSFRSFYVNGFLRWQGDFHENRPTGTWNYYFPDGSPKMILEFAAGGTLIRQVWNEKGKQVVKNGEGSFFLRDFQFGYNSTGHEALLYRGRVRQGLPYGQWMVYYQYPGGRTGELGSVAFRNGRTTGVTPVRFAESEFFTNAENFTAKHCAVDDQINFSEYLRNHLNFQFDFSTLSPERIPSVIEATLEVTREGEPKHVTVNTVLEKAAASGLKELLSSITYWIPSQKDGQVIDDSLIVSLEILRREDNSLIFGYPRITRTNGK